jgi:hypothetical protein
MPVTKNIFQGFIEHLTAHLKHQMCTFETLRSRGKMRTPSRSLLQKQSCKG